MMVMIVECVKPSLRGELTRWLIEPHAGVFVGHVTAMVRDKLWEHVCSQVEEGGVIQIWSTNNEQHYDLRTYGTTQRSVVDYEGLKLVVRPHKKQRKPRPR